MWLFLVFVSGLLPHTRSKIPEDTVFLTQSTPFTNRSQKGEKIDIFEKSAIFCPVMRGTAKRHVLFPNEAFFVAKSALGPNGANPPHIHMHTGKIGEFFNIRGFYETRVELGVDGHPQDTPRTRLPLAASGSPSALYGRSYLDRAATRAGARHLRLRTPRESHTPTSACDLVWPLSSQMTGTDRATHPVHQGANGDAGCQA